MKWKLITYFIAELTVISGSALGNEVVEPIPPSLKYIEKSFSQSIAVTRTDDVEVEFCPDNTCDVFVADSEVPLGIIGDAVTLYLYYYSDFYVLQKWRELSETKTDIHTVIRQYNFPECTSSRMVRGRCTTKRLFSEYDISVYFGRYDDSIRTLVEKQNMWGQRK